MVHSSVGRGFCSGVAFIGNFASICSIKSSKYGIKLETPLFSHRTSGYMFKTFIYIFLTFRKGLVLPRT